MGDAFIDTIRRGLDLELLEERSYTPEFALYGTIQDDDYVINMHNFSGFGNTPSRVFQARNSNCGYRHVDYDFTLSFEDVIRINESASRIITEKGLLGRHLFCNQLDLEKMMHIVRPLTNAGEIKPIIIYKVFWNDFRAGKVIQKLGQPLAPVEDYVLINPYKDSESIPTRQL